MEFETIQEAMRQNPDGAGFAIETESGVNIHKGFFSSDDLWASLNSYEGWESVNVIVHSRIATSGKVNVKNCHPFAVSSDHKKLGEWDTYSTDIAMAHNGYISWGKEAELTRYSDTFLFTRDIMAPLYNELDTEDFQNAIECVANGNKCRIATIDKNQVVMYGSGWVKDNGCYYSNDSYKVPVAKVVNACLYCGEPMTWSEAKGWNCPWCGQFVKTCPRCGERTMEWEGSEYCQYCGIIETTEDAPCVWCGNTVGKNPLTVNDEYVVCRDCWNNEQNEIMHILGITEGVCDV